LAQTFQADNVAFDSEGNYYIADWVMSVIRKVTPDGTITTVAGLLGGTQYTGYRGYNGDEIPATQALLHSPAGMAIDAAGNLYIADSFNNRIRKIDTDGIIHTVAGNGIEGYSGDSGPATQAELDTPNGVAVDQQGNIYIADTGQSSINPSTLGGNRIRKVAPDGTITTIAGNGVGGYNADGIPAVAAEVNGPYGLALDSAGNLYLADTFNSRVRKIDMSGVIPTISTVAGNGTAGFSGDGGPATAAELASPVGVSLDKKGSIAIADSYYSVQRVRMVDPSGNIATMAGNGTAGLSGDGGPAAQAMLSYPGGVAFDPGGNLFIADGTYPYGNNRIREVFLVPPAQLNSVVSRKTHGSAGTFDVDLTNGAGIECRSGGAGGGYTLVFTFANPLIKVGSAAVTSGTGSVVSSNIDPADAHNYIVSLAGVSNAQTITVSLTNLTDSAGDFSSVISAAMGVLLGDVNASRRVDAADVSSVRQQTLQPVTASNFRNDINASGRIDAADVSIARQQTLTSLP
jgi:sugar lactone lactonase YvrE